MFNSNTTWQSNLAQIPVTGNPTTVILDEPTSAIDPYSRRGIWDVILNHRHQSTCLVSTHYMQEADILGDRIAIINHGRLKCSGTTMYLKSKYGSGFFLNLTHSVGGMDPKKLEEQLLELLPLTENQSGTVRLASAEQNETSYSIDLESARSEQMVDVFQFLETTGKEQLGVDAFGISESTMEQVFFKVATDEYEEEVGTKPVENETAALLKPEEQTVGNNTSDFSLEATISSQHASLLYRLCLQFAAVIIKRFHMARRSKAGLFFQLIMPLFFVSLMILMDGLIKELARGGERDEMHLWKHDMKKPTVFYSGPKNAPVISSLLNFGLGTRCSTNSKTFNKSSCSLIENVTLPMAVQEKYPKVACSCNSCPNDAVNTAETIHLQTGDLLINLANTNVTDYLLKLNDFDLVGGIEWLNDSSFVDKSLLKGSGINLWDLSWFGFGGSGDVKELDKESFMKESDSKLAFDNPFTTENVFHLMSHTSKYLDLLTMTASPMDVVIAGTEYPLEGRRPTTREMDTRFMSLSFLNAYYNVLLRAKLSTNGRIDAQEYSMTLSTEEVSMTSDDVSMAVAMTVGTLAMISTIALIMPTFNALIITTDERMAGLKQLQFLMGLNRFVYWVANFAWDMALFMVSTSFMVALMACFPRIFDVNLLHFMYVALAFGCGMILAGYLMSLYLSRAHTAVMLEFIFAPFFTVASIVLYYFRDRDWQPTVVDMLTFLPPYFVGDSVMLMGILKYLPNAPALFSWEILGKRFTFCGIWSLAMLCLLFLFESGAWDAIRCAGADCQGSNAYRKAARSYPQLRPDQLDEDVVQEDQQCDRNSLANVSAEKRLLVVNRLSKAFDNKLAVDQVSFQVQPGECFGLLGMNGAGKTTLFKMLTGYHRRTAGTVRLNDNSLFSMVGGRAKPRRQISYCPQENVLFESLTPIEHLHYFGRIRGLTGGVRQEKIADVVKEVGLDEHKDKQSRALSGGNKRKLNFAISVLDTPDLLLLDEMTTGMDPKARKAAWNLLRYEIGVR